MNLSGKQEDMLREIINTGDYEGRAYARKVNCEGLFDRSRENVIMMRVKTYLRTLTAGDILRFVGKVIAFCEELLAPKTHADEELPNSESIKEVLDG